MLQPLRHPHLHPNIWPGVAVSYLAVAVFYGAAIMRRYANALLPSLPPLLYQPAWWLGAALIGTFTLPFLAVKAILEAQQMHKLSTMVQSQLRPPTATRILSVQVEQTPDNH
jgi:hypothetical protein